MKGQKPPQRYTKVDVCPQSPDKCQSNTTWKRRMKYTEKLQKWLKKLFVSNLIIRKKNFNLHLVFNAQSTAIWKSHIIFILGGKSPPCHSFGRHLSSHNIFHGRANSGRALVQQSSVWPSITIYIFNTYNNQKAVRWLRKWKKQSIETIENIIQWM